MMQKNDPRPGQHEGTGEMVPQARHQFGREWILLLLIWSIATVIVAYQVAVARDRVLSQEQAHLLAQTRVIEENLVQQLKGANNALTGIRDDVDRPEYADTLPLLTARLKSLTEAMPGVRAIQVLDTDGYSIASSMPQLHGMRFNQRDFFRLARDGWHEDLHVPPPFATTRGTQTVVLTRSRMATDGSFAGLVVASLEAEYFEIVLRSVLYAPDMVAVMVHGDGLVFVTAPANQRPLLGENLQRPGSMFARHTESRQPASSFYGPMASNGEKRVLALRTIQPTGLQMDQPLVVALTRSYDDVLAAWHADAWVAGLTVVLLGTASCLWLFFNQRKRLTTERAALALAAAERESARRFEFGLKGADLGLWEWNLATDELTINEREWQMLGYTPRKLPLKARWWQSLLHPQDAAMVLELHEAHLRGETPAYRVEHRIRHHDGHWVWVLGHAMVMEFDAQGQPVRLVGTHLDITERVHSQQAMKRMNEQLEALSLTDGLTGVGNRRQFDRTLAAEWMRSMRQHQPLALLLLDVDHFKQYNDHYGHQAGDTCLRQLAQVLSGCLRQPMEQLARYGGEEFVVLLLDGDAAAGSAVAQRCIDAVARLKIAHAKSQASAWVSVSIGVSSVRPSPEDSLERLVRSADAALYKAKQGGRARFAVAEPDSDWVALPQAANDGKRMAR